jgi:hypothetical protein
MTTPMLLLLTASASAQQMAGMPMSYAPNDMPSKAPTMTGGSVGGSRADGSDDVSQCKKVSLSAFAQDWVLQLAITIAGPFALARCQRIVQVTRLRHSWADALLVHHAICKVVDRNYASSRAYCFSMYAKSSSSTSNIR